MPLLHMCLRAEWDEARATGERRAPSLDGEGFIHCSTPQQVALPANRLFRGRDDLVLLVLDEARLPEVRWEKGVPTDPEAMRFPHVYGPIPVDAVVDVVPYLPDADGAFRQPTLAAPPEA